MNTLANRQAGRLGRIGLALLQVFALFGFSLAVPSARAAGTITGVVYHDYNSNGRRDTAATLPNDGDGAIGTAIDTGIAGVLVTAFDAAGVQRGSAVTTATGSYTLNVTGTGPYRIEFTNFPAGYEPGAQGTDNGSTIRFVPDGNSSNIDLGLVLPAAYCQDNPQLATSCFFQGDLVSGPNSTQAALVSFPFSAGSNGPTVPPYDQPTTRALAIPANQIGATWGLAFARSSQRLFAAAFFKKHAGFGPNGPGAIYVINPATNSVLTAFSVPGATRNSHDPSNYVIDNANTAWDAVGKDSLGGLDLADDDSRLFVMNLENRTLYALNPTTGAVLASQPVPLNPPLPGGATCPASDVRPFAVEYHNAQLFIGMVCSAESSQNPANLRAYVYTADPLTLAFSTTPVLDFALNYPRGRANDGGGGPTPSNQPANWNPWIATFTALPPNIGDQNYLYPVYPQPMLTGLAFDANGDMVIGLRDRFGDQTGNQAPSNPADFNQLYFGVTAGDTLRACALPAGGWALESNGLCGARGTPGNPNNSAGQGPSGGEFYFEDDFSTPNNSGDYHDEVSLGAVLQVPGFPNLVATMFDPIPRQVGPNEIADVGARWFNNSTGASSKAFRLIAGDFADGRTFAKANGLGDLVALCNAAPIEIGNRVWRDTNANGVQDPNEPAISGATVRLYRPGFGPDGIAGNADDNDPLETAITNASGHYYFSSASGTSTGNARYNVNLLTSTAYEIRLDNAADYATGPLAGLVPTLPHAAPDQRDSDGVNSGGFAVTAFSTGGAGSNNHNYDFGFSPTPPTSTLSLGNQLWFDADNDGIRNAGELPVANAGVRLYRDDGDGICEPGTGDIFVNEQFTDSNGLYLFSNLSPGDYCVQVLESNFAAGGVLSGYMSSTGGGSEPAPDPDNDVDNDDNGTRVAGLGVVTTLVTLAAGTEPLNENPDNDFITPDANENLTVDFGFFRPYSLGNRVWFDADDDGQLDPGEIGLPGVTVRLLDGTGASVLRTTTTVANGCYRFDNLAAGDYVVEIAASNFNAGGPLAGMTSSTPDEANPNSDVDSNDNGLGTTPDATNGIRSGVVTLGPGNSEPTNEADLCAGDQGTDDNRANLTVDFGFFQPTYSLGNRVWFDLNDNGQIDTGEVGVGGVAVRLLDGTGTTVLSTTTTVTNGCYRFDNLPAGNYVVEIAAANFATGGPLFNYTSSTPDEANPNLDIDSNDNGLGTTPDATNGIRSGGVTLGPGDSEPTNETDLCAGDPGGPNNRSNLTLDFGFYRAPYSLGNRVWFDLNDNGQIDAGEAGVGGVAVRLLDGAGTTVLSTTTTLANGCYRFDNLLAGNYIVEIAATNFATGGALFNYLSSTPDEANPNGDVDSNDNGLGTAPDAANGIRSGVVTLGPGNSEPTNEADLCAGDPGAPNNRSNLTMDFGFYTLSLGNLVWNDLNNNGVFDTGESGLDNVPVRLFLDANNDGAPDGPALRTTTTAGGGLYTFSALTPTTYLVEITPPAGFTSSTGANGALTGPYEPAPDPDNNADNDDNGTIAGSFIRSAPITLTPGNEPTVITATGQTLNTTLDFGLFQPASLGNFVWNDDGDGIQEAGETGVPNVLVTLYNAAGAPIITTTTDANGVYTFTNLIPGDYSVGFSNLPAGSTFTLRDQGADDALDSDADPTTGRTITTTLTAGENDPTWDAGLIRTLSLGNLVWRDANNSGTVDAADGASPGIAGVSVQLYADTNGNGAFDPALDTLITTTTTGATGNYLFTGLTPGDYLVVIPTGNFSGAGALVGFASSSGGGSEPAPDPDNDVDNDDNGTTFGVLGAGGYVAAGAVTLAPNTEPTNDGDTDAFTNLTVDFGFYPVASLGNFVWHDLDGDGVQDAGEPGLPGVTVRLLDAGGNVISTTVTGAGGAYQFSNLPPGAYQVEFVAPDGYGFSPHDQGGNDALDSDPDPATGRTGLVNLTSGQDNPTVDAGLVRLAGLGNLVWQDANANGLQDAGETGVAGVTVRLLDAGGNVISTTVTDSNGNYQFNNLLPGSYRIEFIPPAGQALSRNDQGGDDARDSDPDPFTRRTPLITLPPGVSDLRWDAGLHPAASVGQQVWNDLNGNGVREAGEPGVPNVTVRLFLPGPDGLPGTSDDALVATTTTDSNGQFQFTGLPTGDYFFEVVLPTGFAFTLRDRGGNDDNDSDIDPATGRTPIIRLLPGQNDLSWAAGLVASPTAVELLYFRVSAVSGASVTLEWATAAEINNVGFRLLRAPVNDLTQAGEVAFVPAEVGGTTGATYSHTDTTPGPAVWWYWLVDVDTNGTETVHGPVSSGLDLSALPNKVFLPLVRR